MVGLSFHLVIALDANEGTVPGLNGNFFLLRRGGERGARKQRGFVTKDSRCSLADAKSGGAFRRPDRLLWKARPHHPAPEAHPVPRHQAWLGPSTYMNLAVQKRGRMVVAASTQACARCIARANSRFYAKPRCMPRCIFL